MPFIRVRTTVSTKGFDKLLQEVPVRVEAATKAVAQEIIDDVRQHWSAVSPSSPGSPPAVVSGKLDNSGRARFVKGGLLAEYRAVFEAGHAKFLEHGTRNMAERPFLKPALVRARRRLRKHYAVVFER